MNPARFCSFLACVFLLGSFSRLFAGDAPKSMESVLPAAKLAAALDARPEVEFLSFTKSGSIVVGGVAPYASRAAGTDDASRLPWDGGIVANWVEWDPATGTLTRLMTGVTPKDAARKLKEKLLPPLPDTWLAGDGEGALKRVTSREIQAALEPKSHNPEVVAVSPDGTFVAVTNYEDKEDEMGALVFLRKGSQGWKRVGKEWPAVFLSGPKFSPAGDLVAFQYQTDGYDGPEPWAMVSTVSGQDHLAHLPEASKKLLPYAIAMKPDEMALGWSDGSVTVQSLDRLKR